MVLRDIIGPPHNIIHSLLELPLSKPTPVVGGDAEFDIASVQFFNSEIGPGGRFGSGTDELVQRLHHFGFAEQFHDDVVFNWLDRENPQ